MGSRLSDERCTYCGTRLTLTEDGYLECEHCGERSVVDQYDDIVDPDDLLDWMEGYEE